MVNLITAPPGIGRKQMRRLKTLITKHVNAQVELSWKGAQHPIDTALVEEEARVAAKRLNEYLEMLRARP